MTDDELIAVAKGIAKHLARTNAERAVVARLTDVAVRRAAMIKFREPGNTKQSIDVYLDKDTGVFITASFALGHD